jgi:hypothetical protein
MPKLRCYEKQTTAKYLNRPSPPYPAADCSAGHEETGNDGNTWYIMKNKNGVGRWVNEATFWGYNKRNRNQSSRKSVKSRRKSRKSRRKSSRKKSRRKSSRRKSSRKKSRRKSRKKSRRKSSRRKSKKRKSRK